MRSGVVHLTQSVASTAGYAPTLLRAHAAQLLLASRAIDVRVRVGAVLTPSIPTVAGESLAHRSPYTVSSLGCHCASLFSALTPSLAAIFAKYKMLKLLRFTGTLATASTMRFAFHLPRSTRALVALYLSSP